MSCEEHSTLLCVDVRSGDCGVSDGRVEYMKALQDMQRLMHTAYCLSTVPYEHSYCVGQPIAAYC